MAVSKCPCLTLSAAMSCLDGKISLVLKHQLMVPATLFASVTHIATDKTTKINYKRKVQRPMTMMDPDAPRDLMVYNVDKSVHVFIREETPGYASLVKKITEEGIYGLKGFFWAERAPSLGEGMVRVFPGQFAPVQDW